jgi:hypothetical protein
VLEQHRQEGLFLKPDSQAALAQFASTKTHLENHKTEPPANLMSSFHEEGEPGVKGATRLLDHCKGTASCKSPVEYRLPEDPRSSGEEPSVHCLDLECKPY